MKLQIVLEPSEDGGYTAIVPALPGCLSEGDTPERALANVREAIALYLETIDGGRRTLSPEGTPEDREQTVKELLDFSRKATSGSGGRRWTREELHERFGAEDEPVNEALIEKSVGLLG